MKFIFNNLLVCVCFLFAACGANHNEAENVNLDSQVLSLQSKVSLACALIAKQATSPNFDELDLGQFCTNEKAPPSLGSNDEIGFSSMGDKSLTFANGDKVRSINTQSEIWLNRSMLNLVTRFKKELAKNDEDVVKEEKIKKKKMDLEILEKAQLDRKNMRITLKVKALSPRQKNGFLNVNNELIVTAQLMEGKYIFATAETVGVTPVETSLFRSLKAAVIIVPHANDMYVGILTRIDLHSYGDGVDKKTKNIILGVIQDALKKIPEFLGEIEP